MRFTLSFIGIQLLAATSAMAVTLNCGGNYSPTLNQCTGTPALVSVPARVSTGVTTAFAVTVSTQMAQGYNIEHTGNGGVVFAAQFAHRMFENLSASATVGNDTYSQPITDADHTLNVSTIVRRGQHDLVNDYAGTSGYSTVLSDGPSAANTFVGFITDKSLVNAIRISGQANFTFDCCSYFLQNGPGNFIGQFIANNLVSIQVEAIGE